MFRYTKMAVPLASRHRSNWWLRLTAPPGAEQYDLAVTHQEREHLRHSQLTSWTAPLVFFAPLLLLQQALTGDRGTIIAMLVLMASAVVAVLLNRASQQVLAALLLVFAMDMVIEGALLTAPGGLSTGWILSFDLFVIPLITAGVLLGRGFLWGFMVFHVGCILGDFWLLPHAPDLVALIHVWHGPTIAFARPLIVQIGVGMLSFIEVRSTDQAIGRADRAQVIIALQETIAREKQRLEQEHRQLEAGVQEIVEILAQAANGQFTRRSTLPKESALWQIGASLNLLFARLQHMKHTEEMVQQIEQEIYQWREALHNGIMPLPSGGLLDPLLRDQRVTMGLDAPFTAPFSWEQPAMDTAHRLPDHQPQRSSGA